MVLETTKYKEGFKKDTSTFALLQDTKRKEEIDKALETAGIKKIIMFDEAGTDWKQIVCREALTLFVLPLTNKTTEKVVATKLILQQLGLTQKRVYNAVDVVNWSEEHAIKEQWTYYFPHKNLILSAINPFADEKVWNITISSILKLNPKFCSQDELYLKALISTWKKSVENKKADLEYKFNNSEKKMSELKDEYKRQWSERLVTKESIASVQNFLLNSEGTLKTELEAVKQLPFVKSVTITDTLNVNIGNVAITGKIKTGEEKKDGMRVPKIETKKVKIGNLTFHIGEEITLTNDTPLEAEDGGEKFDHPHADNGELCFGDEGINVEDMKASFNLKRLVQFLYAWAYSYNKESCYRQLEEFYDENGSEE